MMASLYPDPLDVDEVIALTGLSGAASQRTHKLSGGQTQRVRFAMAMVGQPRAAGAGRADGRAGRRGPPRVLAVDARVRGARQDRAVRHPLPGGGRRQRRPRDPDGARADRRRRSDDRDQGAGRNAHAPRDAARTSTATSWPACRRAAPPSATATRSSCAARTPTGASARCSSTIRRRGTSRSPGRRSRRRSSS